MRLASVEGELIDRSKPLEFEFEGRRCTAFRGDTISSALLASGVRVLGRSFKYHRPRGVLSGAGHDANVLMQVSKSSRSIPNVRGDLTEVEPGWVVRAVNTRGGAAHDRLALLGHLAPFLPVGFYYKAFHSKRYFPHWERLFRHLAGLGQVDFAAPRQLTAKRYDFCDVVVIGAGPSGLAAALAAAERGATVLLVDENPAPGGSGLYARGCDPAGLRATQALIAAVRVHPRVRLLTRTFAAGYYGDHWVALVAPDHLRKVRSRGVIIAQGAFEQPAVFRGNDLPGVMLASAAQRLLYRFAVMPSRRAVVLTANVEGYAAALDGLSHGVQIVGVLDLRAAPGVTSTALAEELAARGVPLHCAVEPIEAQPARDGSLASLTFKSHRTASAGLQHLTLDGLWMSVGFAPANALLQQAGARLAFARELEQFVPEGLPPGVYGCGKVNGVYSLEGRIADGHNAGNHAAAALGFGPASVRARVAACRESPNHPFPIFPHPRGLEFVDLDEDLQLADLRNACQEGFDNSELLKRFSTLGMGPSQGKHSNLNGLRVLAQQRGESVERLGMTTARPMFHPVPLSHLAGRGFTPQRRTALDAEHEALGACWMPAGSWRRPEYYPVAGKSREAAIADEVRAVRTACGLIDVGTLGKIEVHGPEAVQLLERVYTGRFADLRVGMTRYGLMLDEAGVIADDGVVARFGPESFYLTTTTGNSASIFLELGRLTTWWGLNVALMNLTGHYAAINVAGPAARSLLARHTTLDLSNAAFPYLAARQATVAGAPCRILRVGFVGEVGYEIHLPVEHAVTLWRALLASGEPYGARCFGVQAQRILRLEKGHIIVGQDTDGLTNALEINMPWALKMDKPFFIGQRSLEILKRQPPKQTLVGFQLPPEEQRHPKEGHLVIEQGEIRGRVTSCAVSPTLGRAIGLALVKPGESTERRLRIRIDHGAELVVEIVALPFHDPRGERQRIDGFSANAAERAAPCLPAAVLSPAAAPRAGSKRAPSLARINPSLRVKVHRTRARFGCKGPAAEHWIRRLGIRAPTQANAGILHDGLLIARLGTTEFLLEAMTDSAAGPLQPAALSFDAAPAGVYPVPRQDFVMTLEGQNVNELLRQVCNVNFEPLWNAALSADPIVLTSMIGVSVVAWPHRSTTLRHALTLWIDPSFANYFRDTLLEVGRHLGDVELIDECTAESA
jgi:sarcosine oxidase, subunit alpha